MGIQGKLLRRLAIIAATGLMTAHSQAEAALVISAAPSQNVACSVVVCTATAQNAVMNASALQNLLATSSVTLSTGSQTTGLIVETSVTWVSASTLTLSSHRIEINAPVSVAGTGGLALATNLGGTPGTFGFGKSGNVTFWTVADSLTINGKPYTLVNSIAMLAADITKRPSGRYALANSYDATPDGTYAQSPILTPFAGAFDGLGNTISNLTINDQNPNDGLVGLFAQSGAQAGSMAGGELRNLSMINFSVTGTTNVGGLVAENYGTIRNVRLSGVVGGTCYYAGGLISENAGWIIDANVNASVSCENARFSVAGGLVAQNEGVIRDSKAKGMVAVTAPTGISQSAAGGFVGINGGLVENSRAAVSIEGSFYSGGGFAGINYSWIMTSSASGTLNCSACIDLGDLVGEGFPGSVIDKTYATGSSVVQTQGAVIGALVGSNGGTITHSYAIGNSAGGANITAGGFVGNEAAGAVVSQTYAIGSEAGGRGSFVGGFVGEDGSADTIATSYWDTTTSGTRRGVGNRGNEPGVTGETTTQLQSGLPAGFDTMVWGTNPAINGGLPYLLANPPG